MVEKMKEHQEEKPQKKHVKKSKFRSALDLPIGDSHIKGEDDFLVASKDIEMTEKTNNKKQSTNKKTKNKNMKLNKDVNKLLLQPIKTSDTGEKIKSDDAQWLIKKDIVKAMGSAQKVKRIKKRGNVKNKNEDVTTTRSEGAKENQAKKVLRPLSVIKSEYSKDLKQLPRKNTKPGSPQQNLRKQASIPPQLNDKPKSPQKQNSHIPTILQMTKPSLVQELKARRNNKKPIQKLKHIFNVFKHEIRSPIARSKDKKLDVMFSREMQNQHSTEAKKEKKTVVKNIKEKFKRIKTPETKKSSEVSDPTEQMKAMKAKLTNKIRLKSAIPSNENKTPVINKGKGNKKGKSLPQKLENTITI